VIYFYNNINERSIVFSYYGKIHRQHTPSQTKHIFSHMINHTFQHKQQAQNTKRNSCTLALFALEIGGKKNKKTLFKSFPTHHIQNIPMDFDNFNIRWQNKTSRPDKEFVLSSFRFTIFTKLESSRRRN